MTMEEYREDRELREDRERKLAAREKALRQAKEDGRVSPSVLSDVSEADRATIAQVEREVLDRSVLAQPYASPGLNEVPALRMFRRILHGTHDPVEAVPLAIGEQGRRGYEAAKEGVGKAIEALPGEAETPADLIEKTREFTRKIEEGARIPAGTIETAATATGIAAIVARFPGLRSWLLNMSGHLSATQINNLINPDLTFRRFRDEMEKLRKEISLLNRPEQGPPPPPPEAVQEIEELEAELHDFDTGIFDTEQDR